MLFIAAKNEGGIGIGSALYIYKILGSISILNTANLPDHVK